MSEVEFFNKYFESQEEIYKLVGIMEFYRYRYKTCNIRDNVGAPPTISIISPLDDYTMPYILDVLTKCRIDFSISKRIEAPHFVIQRGNTRTVNRKPCNYVEPRHSTLLAKGDYKTIFEEKNEK